VDLHGVSAIVTGGAGGLGSATVRRLVAGGAHVGVLDVSRERAEPLLAELGDRAEFFAVDVLDDESIDGALRAMAARAPVRAVVVAHGAHITEGAGRTIGRDGAPHSLAGYRQFIDGFLVGTFNVLRLAASHMSANEPSLDGERGVVVMTSSIAGSEGQIGQVAYAAAKGGVNGMTIVAARDLAAVGIRVVTIAPGTMITPAYGANAEAVEAEWSRLVPFPNRMGRPDEYAALAQHIIENRYLNGEIIRIDGALRFPPKNPPRTSDR
jgi:NAD(P)-dependent dehydrogenase (short-subunit alcohol dehydrogenase family)